MSKADKITCSLEANCHGFYRPIVLGSKWRAIEFVIEDEAENLRSVQWNYGYGWIVDGETKHCFKCPVEAMKFVNAEIEADANAAANYVERDHEDAEPIF